MLAIGALLAPGLLRRGADAVPSAPRQALRLGSTATLAASCRPWWLRSSPHSPPT